MRWRQRCSAAGPGVEEGGLDSGFDAAARAGPGGYSTG